MSRRPSTPGALLIDQMEATDLTQSDVARRIGVGRQTINELVRGKRAMTPDIAHRLGKLFGGGPDLWLLLQAQVDMWDALHIDTSKYANIEQVQAV